ncbi:hypothetical protein TNCV_2901011 [Trichonephila clavipes]|nr:hypothetical protein TNCV_2901011 [Trichonephila clavipes]
MAFQSLLRSDPTGNFNDQQDLHLNHNEEQASRQSSLGTYVLSQQSLTLLIIRQVGNSDFSCVVPNELATSYFVPYNVSNWLR